MRKLIFISLFLATATLANPGVWGGKHHWGGKDKNDHHQNKNFTKEWKRHTRFATCAISNEEDHANCLANCS
jgi:hypothetical protein